MTSEEIVKALRTCVMDPDDGGDCENCPASRSEGEYCLTAVMSEAASLIEQLRREIEWKDSVIGCAQKKRAEAEAERDALIEQIKERHDCLDCKHNDFCEYDGKDGRAVVLPCKVGDAFQVREESWQGDAYGD